MIVLVRLGTIALRCEMKQKALHTASLNEVNVDDVLRDFSQILRARVFF
jgi:hypothetical protein